MEEKSKNTYREYSGMSPEQRILGRKIEEKIIPLSGKFLDYLEVMFKTLDLPEDSYADVLKEIRSKILRDSNDAVRKLLEELKEFRLSHVRREIIKIRQR